MQSGEYSMMVLVANNACPKLMKDMHYKARIHAVITNHA